MNSSFVCISILVKSRLPKNCLEIYLNEVSSQLLRNYLLLVNVQLFNMKCVSNFICMIIFFI